eukprot:EG_transcript_2980
MKRKYLPAALLAVVASVVLLVVPPWTVTVANAKRVQRAGARGGLQSAANRWRAAVAAELNGLVDATVALAGFVSGGARGIPDHNGSVAERMAHLINPDTFDLFASGVLRRQPALRSLQLQPSGVIAQVYPPHSGAVGLDLLNLPDLRADISESIQAADVHVLGPLLLVDGTPAIVVVLPVFLGLPRTMATWWGNAGGVVSVQGFLNATNISGIAGQAYAFRVEFVNLTTGESAVLAQSCDQFDKTRAVASQVTLPGGAIWSLYLAPSTNVDYTMTWMDVLPIAAVAVAASAVGVGLVWLAHCSDRQHRRDTALAPVHAPLTLVFTDIEGSTDLWNSHPRAMGTALTQHNAIIRRLIKTHRAYEVKTVGDSFMIACKTPATALDLVLDAMASLQNADWPPELEQHYGVPWLRVRAGVHLCADVQCVYDVVAHSWDYVGNDVNKTARIVSKAKGDEVFVSGDLAQAVVGEQRYRFEPAGLHQLRGIKVPQELFQLQLRPPSPLRRTASQFGPRSIAVVPTAQPTRMSSDGQVSELVRTAMEMTSDPDERQLTEWLLFCRRFLKLAMNPLSPARKDQFLSELCEGWGLAPQAHTDDQLSFRLAPILQQRYPALFRPGSRPLPPVQPTRPEFDLPADHTPIVMGGSMPHACPTSNAVLLSNSCLGSPSLRPFKMV